MKNSLSINADTLKLIALITMIIDHMGALLFPENLIFRCIGRLAFPIYAYMIGEGCKYSKNKWKYLLQVVATLIVFQIIYYYIHGYTKICVLYGFACAILSAILIEWAKKNIIKRRIMLPIPIMFLIISTIIIDSDYDMFSVILPLIVYIIDNKKIRLSIFTFVLCILSTAYQMQYFCLIDIILLILYNGKKSNLKYNRKIFYIFYPLHYLILGMIKLYVL